MRSSLLRTTRWGLGRLRSEAGQSLVLALVVLGALTVGTAGVITFMTSNEKSFSESIDANRALGVAEAGLQNGISVVTQYDASLKRLSGSSIPDTNYTSDGGSGTWWAVKDSSTSDSPPALLDVWTVSATGTSSDGKVTRNVQERVQANPTGQSPIYNYALYVEGQGGGCTNINGNSSVSGNIWIGNNLCPQGNVSLTPSKDDTYTLYVGGNYQGGGSSNVGASGQTYKEVSIVKGCTYNNKAVSCSDSSKSHVYAYCSAPNVCNYDSIEQNGIKPSGTTLTRIYNLANWSTPTCTGTPPTFESSSTPSTNPTNTVTLDSNTYDCNFFDSSGTWQGHIAYNSSTNTLTASGAIFVDGNLTLTNSHGSAGGFSYKIDSAYWPNPVIDFNGGAAIYVNGTVTSKTDVCGPSDSTTGSSPNGNSCTNGPWTPLTRGSLEFVALNVGSCNFSTQTCNPNSTGWTASGNGEIDADVWVDGQIDATGNGGSTNNFFGAVIVDAGNLSGGGGLQYPVPPPSEGPGAPGHSWQITPSSWRQCGAGYTSDSDAPTTC